MTENELKESLKKPEGGYLFYGDEDYMKQHYVRRLRDAVLGGALLPEMNHIKFDRDDFSLPALEDALATPPVMDDGKLIEISLPDLSFMKEDEQESFRDALKTLKDSPGTVLVLTVAPGGFDPGKPKSPSAAMKAYSKLLKPVEFPLQPEGKLVRWLARHAADAGVVPLAAVGRCAGDDELGTLSTGGSFEVVVVYAPCCLVEVIGYSVEHQS